MERTVKAAGMIQKQADAKPAKPVTPSEMMRTVPARSVRQTSTPASRRRLRAASWGWP